MITRFENLKSNMSPLTVYGGVFLLFLIGVWGVLQISYQVHLKKSAVFAAQAELQKLRNIKTENMWGARLLQSTDAKKAAEITVWQGATNGVIAATLQQNLRAIAQSVGMTNVRIDVSPDPETIESMEILAFDMTGMIPAATGPAHLLKALASESQTILIQETSFTLDPMGRWATNLTISGIIPMSIDPPTATERAP